MKEKTCTKCGETKSATLEFFYQHKECKGGLSTQCKQCTKACRKENRERNPQRDRDYQKKRREQNPGYPDAYRATLRGYVAKITGEMKQRCVNPNNPRYRHYGGRGICCSFTSQELYNWCIENNVDPRGLDTHRIDNDGNYTLDNIVFLIKSEHTKLHRYQEVA